MKYLKLYESLHERSVQDIFDTYPRMLSEALSTNRLNCNHGELTNLNGIEQLPKLEIFYCGVNKLKNLKGIENCKLLSLINCSDNKLTNLKELTNLKQLNTINCANNLLKNLDDILDLPNLRQLHSDGNPFEFPLPSIKMIGDYYANIYQLYDNKTIKYFRTYELQKKFLTKYPERVKDLEPFGFHEKIKEEFADLIEGSEFGFFNLR